MQTLRKILGAGLMISGFTAAVASANTANEGTSKCLFVSSYHKGYAWSDGVERGLRAVLEARCELRQFDMDTKRLKSEDDKKKQAREAKAMIESWSPDIVITADDNAAKYLIQQYYRDAELPFVFSGVNWTVESYGFPYSNVTGMIEVAPIEPMFKRAEEVSPGIRRAFYLGADTLTEKKNLKRFQAASKRLGIELEFVLAGTMEAWMAAYGRAQEHDLIIMGSNAGINDWDPDQVRRFVGGAAQRLSVTNHYWMMPYTMIGITKVAEEQGEWAGKTALRILDGMQPGEIPIVANSRRDIWINPEVLSAAEIRLPRGLKRKAKRVTGFDSNS
ncbi:ABC transporter substrate-binding protein [Pelagibius sp. Alg239-R121]|uniref:ABC transporter substrate-binding protein n=1 Tax=Pelagibius sp. Alg239-R121 TaxID=2993448 RepID=UPI0024A6526A|nr:hypothetical protein [Pelagibius sp. Alg239-R121]